MHKPLIFFSFLGLMAFACSLGATPSATATPEPAEPVASVPPVASATASPVLFRDDFEGSLAVGWQWLHEDPTHWSLTATPGHLRIIVQPSSVNEERVRNFLVRPAPDGNFEIGTLLRFTPTSNFQFAGLLIYQAQGNAMQFGRAFAQCGSAYCVGNAIYFDSYQAFKFDPTNFATQVDNPSVAYLRLSREGTNYTAYYSSDGNNWNTIGQHTSSITPTYVGLIAAQAQPQEVPADFDYFTIKAMP